jgi:hypothetical protein
MMMTTKATTNTSSFVIHNMNARAISFMEQGKNQEAVQVLQQAVEYLSFSQHVMERYQEAMTSCSYDFYQQCQGTRNLNECVPVRGVEITSAVSTTSDAVSSLGEASRGMIHLRAVSLPQLQHSQAIYDCAFHLPFSDEMIMSIDYRTQAIAVLFYNTAIAFHRYGIQSGKSEALGDAAAFYNAILTMLGPHGLQLYPEVVVIVLALMSNLAHIHLELRQLPEFLYVRATLRELMFKTPHVQMSEQDFAFFNFTLFCLDREDVRFAPAA